MGVPDRYVGEDLVAFAVLRDGMRCDELELLSFCESHLGYFKTPTRVHFVADLPKGPSGKVQRLRLAEEAERLAATSAPKLTEGADASAMTEQAVGDEDGLPIEQIITEIWTELLASPQIEPDSNFFALGGQSLQAIQCLSRLRERTQILLSLADFFENPTVVRIGRFGAAPPRASKVAAKRQRRSIPGRFADDPGAGPQPAMSAEPGSGTHLVHGTGQSRRAGL